MANAMFAETLDNSQHSMWLIAESRSYTLNSSRENLRTRIIVINLLFCLSNFYLKSKCSNIHNYNVMAPVAFMCVKRRLRAFEKRILRATLFGLKKKEVTESRRKLRNEELRNLYLSWGV
jgi:hypothetical protein